MTTNFKESTQYKNWFFHENEARLAEIRQEISKNVEEEIVSTVREKAGELVIKVECLSVQEELATIRKNISIISALCERFKFHLHVEGTAMIYFKRFLLYHSVMELDINNLMLTCIFLAAKTEENHITLEKYLQLVAEFTGSHVDKREIQKTELILLQALQFHLIVYHPYRSLYAFVHDFFEADRQHESHKLYENAKKFLKDSYQTDVSFLYPPGTIALAALYHFNPTDTEHFIEKKYSSKDIERLVSSIKIIQTTVLALSTSPQAEQNSQILKGATQKLKRVKKVISTYKVFDTEELEKKFRDEEHARRERKLKEREEEERRQIEELLK